MIFERTYDAEFITNCLTSPHVWRMSSNDSIANIDPELFFVPEGDEIFWLKSGEYGLFMGERRNACTYDVHVALFPNARGKAVEIASGAIRWMFCNSTAKHLIASIPEFNNLAMRLALRCGMKPSGISQQCFIKNGNYYDQYLYQINKEDTCHQ